MPTTGNSRAVSFLVSVTPFQLVARAFEPVEYACDRRVIDGLLAVIDNKVLLADIGYVIAVGIFGE